MSNSPYVRSVQISLTGELDLMRADDLVQEITRVVLAGSPHIDLDLTNLAFCDASGLGALVRARRACTDAGGGLTLLGARGSVRRVLALTGMLDHPASAKTRADTQFRTEEVMTSKEPSAPSSGTGSDGAEQLGTDDHDEADLNASLQGMSALLLGSQGLEALLTRVAEFAVRAIPGAEGAGVTLLQDDRADTIVASADFVRQVDAIQYGLGEGPCISAAAERRTVRSGHLGADGAWPQFGPRVAELGVHSVLSLPLLLPDHTVGAINVYAHPEDVFGEQAQELGELFAMPAAVAVHNAQVLDRARRVAEQLQAALSSRAIIDQAIGILISRSGDRADQAFASLKTLSQTNNTKLSTIASHVVDEAARRARARKAKS